MTKLENGSQATQDCISFLDRVMSYANYSKDGMACVYYARIKRGLHLLDQLQSTTIDLTERERSLLDLLLEQATELSK